MCVNVFDMKPYKVEMTTGGQVQSSTNDFTFNVQNTKDAFVHDQSRRLLEDVTDLRRSAFSLAGQRTNEKREEQETVSFFPVGV